MMINGIEIVIAAARNTNAASGDTVTFGRRGRHATTLRAGAYPACARVLT